MKEKEKEREMDKFIQIMNRLRSLPKNRMDDNIM